MNDKLRERTEEEMELQNKGLLEIKELLDQEGLTWFISGGTLLGAARNNDFIKWDWDVDIALLAEECVHKKDELEVLLKEKGFEFVKRNNSRENFKLVVKKYGAFYELLAWFKSGDMRIRKIFKRPAEFYEKPGTVILRGEIYPCPTPLEDFLEYVYGDWRKPKKSTNKNVYFTSKNLRGSKLQRLFEKGYHFIRRRVSKLIK